MAYLVLLSVVEMVVWSTFMMCDKGANPVTLSSTQFSQRVSLFEP
jgi:hypothetical protein